MLKHIGTAHTEAELATLKKAAADWVTTHPHQSQLFPSDIINMRDCEYHGFRYTFAHEFFYSLCRRFDFTSLNDRILTDLVIMRIFEPASKLRSLTLLSQYFNITHSESALYRSLRRFPGLKESVEERLVVIAKKEFGFDFSFVLYDVTTLYFETFKSDKLRKPGFSKDNKAQQPQIAIGLMVTPEGFPVSYEVFAGNTFEGATFLPSILAFKSLHKITTLTIVADAAMLSLDNIQKLVEHKLTYIVGARLRNISTTLLETIDTTLPREDGATARITTPSGDLVYAYSHKRYIKDLSDMNKQIRKAEAQVQTPSKMKRAKFVSATANDVALNDSLIARTKKLLGVKGYYTNLKDVPNPDIIAHYHSLWNIEQAFRIAKSDLVSRPIFHRKEVSIRAHVLICVMALSISKYLEIKTRQSIRSVLDICKSVTDAVIHHRKGGQDIIMRTPIPETMIDIEEMASH